MGRGGWFDILKIVAPLVSVVVPGAAPLVGAAMTAADVAQKIAAIAMKRNVSVSEATNFLQTGKPTSNVAANQEMAAALKGASPATIKEAGNLIAGVEQARQLSGPVQHSFAPQ